MNTDSLTQDQINQLAYEFIEDGDEKVARKFYDFCWNYHRNHMRVLIESYVASEGEDDFNNYLNEVYK